MRLLFVHNHFPGQFGPLLQHLVRAARHEIVFISQDTPGRMDGVLRRTYTQPATSHRTHFDARDFDLAMRRAAAVAGIAAGLRQQGFGPDIVLGHEGWGEMLSVQDVWPTAPRLVYREYFYLETGADAGWDPEFPTPPGLRARIRAKNAPALLSLLGGDPGVTPTRWQRSLYPRWAQPGITVVPDGVDLDLCRPRPGVRAEPLTLGRTTIAPGVPLVTFVARDLEPYRGFHTLMRAAPALLAARADLEIVCLGADGVSYGTLPPSGTWRQYLSAGLALDPARLHFPGIVPHADHVRLLQRSDIHLYLSYPFIASWSLREALACGCTVVAADTPAIAEFGGLCRIPPLDPAALTRRVLDLLDRPDERARYATEARRVAEAGLGSAQHIAGYVALIEAMTGQPLA